MPPGAGHPSCIYGRWGTTPKNVDTPCNRFQVVRIYTNLVSTQVIEVKALGSHTNQVFICPNMHLFVVKYPIAAAALAAHPFPADAVDIYATPESLLGTKSMHGYQPGSLGEFRISVPNPPRMVLTTPLFHRGR
jgi:hypothetical protein